MKLTTKTQLALGFCLIITLLLLNSAFSYSNTRRLIANQEWVNHTYRVITEINEKLSELKDAETGTRGYVVTGREEYLEPYKAALEKMKGRLEPLRLLVADNPAQTVRVAEFSDAINARLVLCEQTVELRRTQGFDAAQRSMLSGVGKARMDAARAIADAMLAEEKRLLTLRAAETAFSAKVATLTIGFAAVVNLILLSYIWSLLARAEVSREQTARVHSRLEAVHAELQRAEGMRDSLTAMLVHDLRTPLTTLLGSLELLNQPLDQPLAPELQREMIGMSVQGGYRLLSLVNELLDISKMEAGEMKVRLDTVQLRAVADEAIRQVQSFHGGETDSSAQIKIEMPPDLPVVQADHELLARVMINLVGNALKFTPRSGTITVAARVVNPVRDNLPQALVRTQDAPDGVSNSVALCSVADTGEGIPKEDLDKVFDKFGQVETRKAGRKNSTGLGLTFCKLAIEAHGGRIWVESEPGKGSVFYFTVPLRPWELERDAQQAIKAEAASQS